MNTQAPAISGQLRANQKLTASNGTWTGTAPITFTYAWSRCDSAGTVCASTGKGGSTYALANADVGYRMVVTVTAANAGGTKAAASSPTAGVRTKNGKTARLATTMWRVSLKRRLIR